jgi:ribosome-binding protein aMBF1 (putative translation factor)
MPMKNEVKIMGETIKCACPDCKAKYRLPAEAAGRKARCKICGTKFHVPGAVSLEDSVLNWLNDESFKTEEDSVDKPKVIQMPKDAAGNARKQGVVRLKDATPPQESTGNSSS